MRATNPALHLRTVEDPFASADRLCGVEFASLDGSTHGVGMPPRKFRSLRHRESSAGQGLRRRGRDPGENAGQFLPQHLAERGLDLLCECAHGLRSGLACCDSAHFLPWRWIWPSSSSRSHASLTVRLFTCSRSPANSFVLAAPRASSARIFSGNPTPASRVPLVVLCSYAAISSSVATRRAPCQSGGLQSVRFNPGLV